MRAGRRGGALAVGVALILTACQAGDGGRASGGTAEPSPERTASSAPARPTATGAPTGPTLVLPGTTVRHDVAAGSAALELTVESVVAANSCPARGVDVEPIETFVILDVAAALATPDATGAPDGPTPADDEPPSGDDAETPAEVYAALTPDLFRIEAPDGRTQQIVATDASWACFDDDELLPPFVDLGEAVSGKVVLDSASAHGSVVYAPAGTAGWKWEF